MVQIISLIGLSFVLFLILIAFTALKNSVFFYLSLRLSRKSALVKCASFLTTKGQIFGNLTLENEFCSVSVKQYENQIVGMSKVFDALGQKKIFVAKCSVEKIWNADSLFNVVANSFNANIKYEDIRRRVIEYSVMQERVYKTDKIKAEEQTSSKENKFNPILENYKSVDVKKDELLGKLIDVNVAGEEELTILPGINAILAKKIVRYRENNGLFESVDDFIEKMEIKESFALKIRSYICAMNFKENNEIQESTMYSKNAGMRELDALDGDEQVTTSGFLANDLTNEGRVIDLD